MKRSALYESAAPVLALIGALMFGFGNFPWLNPIQFEMNYGEEYLPAIRFSLLASIPIMWIAWRLSQEAQRLKKEEGTNAKLESDEAK